MQHGIDCLNFNDKTYSLHKNLAPKTGKCYHGRTKTRFSQRSRRTPDDGNSSLSRFVRSGHKRASRYHQARGKDQRSSDRGGAQQQRKESAVHRGGARRAAKECCKGIQNVSVESFDGLTVEFAKKRHASVMVRGLRAVTDFENEIQLAQTNHALMPGIETMFLATSIKWSYLSSTIVKEAAYYGSDIGKFVTPNVEKAVNEKYALIRQKKDPET